MKTFAQIDSNGIVQRVLVVSQEYINTGILGDPATWIECTLDGLSKTNASRGDKYDAAKKGFHAPKPYPSWVLDDVTMKWKAPVAKPEKLIDERLDWNESTVSWDKVKATTKPK